MKGTLIIKPINMNPFTLTGEYTLVNGIYYIAGESFPQEIVEVKESERWNTHTIAHSVG